MGTNIDTHSQVLCRQRDLGTHNTERAVSTKSFLSELRELHRKGGRKSIRARGTENTRKTRPSQTTQQDLHELRKIEVTSTG